MKNIEIKSLKKEDLVQKLNSEKEILAKLKFANAIAPIENPMKIRHTKNLIARLNTELSSRA
jgi:large subunit ribosomal protein L29